MTWRGRCWPSTRDELVNLASALIRIPSLKTEETPVALFLEEFFRQRGYDVDLQEIEPGRFRTIATMRGTAARPASWLNGHTDINALTTRSTRGGGAAGGRDCRVGLRGEAAEDPCGPKSRRTRLPSERTSS